MRTFRITLSHGDEHVTFDGAGARSGSMFHVRREAIEGLWSSPASKVSLTERETANGASPISDGETLYAARTVVIPFAIQSNYNHTDLIRARTMLGRLIGWHDVRMDINDDGDETVLYGYIEAKYSDIPYDHADTGTITLVCPDPRRVSKHGSTISMNTSSRSLGGLGFGVPAYELAWTGTTNASASTLSQDGKVVATNLILSPLPRAADYTVADGSHVGSPTVSDHPNGMKITSNGSRNPGANNSVYTLPAGSYHLHAELSEVSGTQWTDMLLGFWPAITPYPSVLSDGVVDYDVTLTSDMPLTDFALKCPTDGYAVWRHVGLYTAAGWAAMQTRGVTWFDGDSQSPQPNAGLAFPLGFGQTGNAGNTGMITNNGSYTSMPVITAHGWLDGGLAIHWYTSDGNEGYLSFTGDIGNVPVTINTDTHSAIMGGLDVSYQLGSRDWPRIPAGGSCSFALLASGNGWATVQSHDTYM